MFARVLFQECKPGTVERLIRRAEETLIGPVKGIPGLVSYKIIQIDDHSLIAMGLFEARQGCEELDRIGAQWRKDYGEDTILSVRSSIGEVVLDAVPAREEVHVTH